MTGLVKDSAAMIAGMQPVLMDGEFVFCTTKNPEILTRALPNARAMFHEEEGSSLVISLTDARALGFDVDLPMCQITLMVRSSLEGVGLTAAVSTALAEENIPCNVVAATHHDHVFVPSEMADKAMSTLRKLQRSVRP